LNVPEDDGVGGPTQQICYHTLVASLVEISWRRNAWHQRILPPGAVQHTA